MTTEQEREYVEARWVRAEACSTCHNVEGFDEEWCISLGVCYASDRCTEWFPSEPAAWHAAYEFTLAQAEAIRLVEEEIDMLNSWNCECGIPNCIDCSKIQRILARETAALEALKRGWKG